MPERTVVQSESWRPQQRGGMLDPQVARMGLVACGAVLVLALGYGGYAMMARAPVAVPLIEADSRPLRVRPDNPGGMQVAGAEEQIMGADRGGRADTMAPAAEAPQPQALRAQIQAAQQLPPAQPASLSMPAPTPPPVVVSDMPEQRVVTAVRPRALPVPAPHAAGLGQVQLAALESEADAMTEWQRLAKKMPDLLGARSPAVIRAERDGKTFYRLRTGGFADMAQATRFCAQIRAKGAGCIAQP